MKIKNFCNIQMGFSFREKVDFSQIGIPVIQLNDLKDEGFNSALPMKKIPQSHSEFKESHLIENDDIVFRTRGKLLNAYHITNIKEPYLLSAPLLRIRCDKSKIIPKYLVWALNNSKTQAQISSPAGASGMRMISKKDLEEVDVKLPDISRQYDIVEFISLAETKNKILHKMIEKSNQLQDAYIYKLIRD